MTISWLQARLWILSTFFVLCTHPASAEWATQFHLSGPDGTVECAQEYAGDLVIGGHFNAVGPVAAARIAAFNGVTWRQLGEGLSGGDVASLILFEGDLIACGSFTETAGTPVQHIARWDGVSWNSMGLGIASEVSTMAVLDGQLYCHDMRWNGADWEPFIDLVGTVYDLEVHGGLLLIGGALTTVDGASCDDLIAWNGSEIVSAYGGLDQTVRGIASWGDSLVVLSYNIYSYDPVLIYEAGNWQSTEGLGVNGYGAGVEYWALGLRNLVVVQNRLFITKTQRISDYTFWYSDLSFVIAEYVDGQWVHFFGCPENVDVSIHGFWSDRWIIGGLFQNLADVDARNLAFIQDGVPQAVVQTGHGFGIGTRALSAGEGQVMAAGNEHSGRDFIEQHSGLTQRWDVSDWTGHSFAYSLVIPYLRGDSLFRVQGVNLVGYHYYLDHWQTPDEYGYRTRLLGHDGSWHSIPGSVEGLPIDAAAIDPDIYYATSDHVLHLDSDMTATVVGSAEGGSIRAVLADQSKLITGGDFETINGVQVGPVGVWNGLQWSSLTHNLSGTVHDFVLHGGLIHASGDLSIDGEPEYGRVVVYEHSTWTQVGPVFSATPVRIVSFQGRLVVNTNSATAADRLVALSGEEWTSFAGPINGTVNSLAPDGDRLWIGGYFNMVDGVPAAGLTYWENEVTANLLSDFTGTSTAGSTTLRWMLNDIITGHINVVRRTEWGEAEVAQIGLDGAHEYTCTVTSSNMTAAIYALIHVNADGHRLELGSLAVEAAIPSPHDLTLSAFPNPFNPAVTIRPNLGHRGDVSIRVHDPRGRVVVTLYEGPGMNCPESLIWEGRNASGRDAPSGVYLATFKADGKRASRKIVLAR